LNIHAGGNNHRVQDGVELSKVRRKEYGLHSGNVGSNVSHFGIDGLSHTDSKEDNTSILGRIENSLETRGLYVVSTIGENNKYFLYTSSSVLVDLIVSQLNTTTDAGTSGGLDGVVDGVDERLLYDGERRYDSRNGGEVDGSHSNVLRSKGVSVRNTDNEVLLCSERSGIDRSRIIDDEHEVDLLAALWLGAVPTGVNVEHVRIRLRSGVGEVNSCCSWSSLGL